MDAWQGVGKHAGRCVWMSGRDHKDKMCLYTVKTWEFTRLAPNPIPPPPWHVRVPPEPPAVAL